MKLHAVWHCLVACCFLLMLPQAACLYHYRVEVHSGNMPREIVERERDLLLLRMSEWEDEMRVLYEGDTNTLRATAQAGEFQRRLARGRQVLRLFEKKLRYADENEAVVFTREEWRQAVYVGCERYR